MRDGRLLAKAVAVAHFRYWKSILIVLLSTSLIRDYNFTTRLLAFPAEVFLHFV
jgi:hypothetical protein